MINPFADIPINSVERIEFSDLIITSSTKELGRSKMIIKELDIQNIGEYLKTISCVESNRKEKEPDFEI